VASQAEQRAAVKDIPVLNDMYDRLLEHLTANEIDPDTATLGPWLDVDVANECFQDNTEANKLVRGCYRQPFVVPDFSI